MVRQHPLGRPRRGHHRLSRPLLMWTQSLPSMDLFPTSSVTNADGPPTRRHAAFVARLQTLAPNPPHAVAALKAAIRSYRASESAARDLIQTTWTVLDRELENTATVINMLVDLLDDDEKKQDLLSAWNGFKVEVCLFT